MLTLSNTIYSTLKKHGLHQWRLFGGEESVDYDFNDLDLEDEYPPSWLLELEE